MKLLRNKTSKSTIVIDNMKIFSIMGAKLHTGAGGFAVVTCTEPGVGFPIAEFTEVEDAEKCLDKVFRYFTGNHDNDMYVDKNGVLEIEDIVAESLLVMPDNIKNKKPGALNVIKS